MSVCVIVQCRIHPESLDEYRRVTAELLPETRAFDGNEALWILEDPEDPTSIVMMERWTSPEAYQRYAAWRQERGDTDRIVAMMADRSRLFLHDTGL
jgi:quinol monooxygenase YgiN